MQEAVSKRQGRKKGQKEKKKELDHILLSSKFASLSASLKQVFNHFEEERKSGERQRMGGNHVLEDLRVLHQQFVKSHRGFDSNLSAEDIHHPFHLALRFDKYKVAAAHNYVNTFKISAVINHKEARVAHPCVENFYIQFSGREWRMPE